jgi:hypothetical protein
VPATRLSEALPGHTMQADLLIEAGPEHLVQVEFVTHVTADLIRRMVEYRARVMDLHPKRSLQQHILVLGTGRIVGEVRDAQEFWMRLHILYARDQDPADMLKSPSLAPLAVLGRSPDHTDRGAVLRAALRTIQSRADPARRKKLLATAATLAAIHLDAVIIRTILEELEMPIDLSDTSLARSFLEQGRQEGRQQGTDETTAEVAAVMLRRRFGDDERIDVLAAGLARCPVRRLMEVLETGESLEAIREALEQDPG